MTPHDTARAFPPKTSWPALEAARVRHERALAEVREARHQEAQTNDRHKRERAQAITAAAGRVLDAEPAVDPAADEDVRRRELDAIGVRIRAARQARDRGVKEAVQLIGEHPEWREEVAGRRAAALAEQEQLLAKAAAAGALAHREAHLEKWLAQAVERTPPQPFRAPDPPPPPPPSVADVFGSAA